ncbi:hypothetical protein MAR_008351 [Mya arenaria]|uniref:Uncharacterized protein n=1 Tax=Mya arenaria TaxID=6604 RepID=A0ABY7DYW3_MYAAR|nr:hypothetical protein MAR_008351 [Mya arenaria]
MMTHFPGRLTYRHCAYRITTLKKYRRASSMISQVFRYCTSRTTRSRLSGRRCSMPWFP